MRQCEMCAKSSKMVGHRIKLRGKFNPTNWSRKYANLQYATIEGKRMHICTGCIRTLHKAPRKRVVKKATAGTTA
jgi:ribosomal protein L28